MPSLCMTLWIFTLFIGFIGSSLGIYIAYKGIYALYHKTVNMNTLFKLLFISSIVAYLACLIFAVSSNSFICTDISLYNSISRAAVFIYYCVLLPLLLITFTARLHYTFRTTIYRMNTNLMRCFYIIIALITVGNAAYFVISVDFYNYSNNDILYQIGLILYFTSFVFFLILSIILVLTFVSKLNELILIQRRSIFSNEAIHLTAQQTNLIGLVSKYIIIACFVFSTTVIFTCAILYMGSTATFNTFVGLAVFRFIGFIDIMCNILGLYLQFNFAAVDYRRFCGFCDAICKKRLNVVTETKINQHSLTASSTLCIKNGTETKQKIISYV